MTKVERCTRELIAAAWRWNVAQGQGADDKRVSAMLLKRAVEAHGDAVKASIVRRMAAAQRAKKK